MRTQIFDTSLDPDPGVQKRIYFCKKSSKNLSHFRFVNFFHDLRQHLFVQHFIDVKNEKKYVVKRVLLLLR